jgi:hypothetical protein
MITKVISGGQTGADVGGLIAAVFHDIQPGGYMPKDWITQAGRRPEYAAMFNMDEHPGSYKERTWANVEASDATIRIACDLTTAGERCTLNAIRNFNKPSFDVKLDKDRPTIEYSCVQSIVNWIQQLQLLNKSTSFILNVAGNSHKTWAGMQSYTVSLLSYVFMNLGHSRIQVNPRYHFNAQFRNTHGQ